MTEALDLLKEKYLTNLKESPRLYIGVELEFPIVNLSKRATDTKVTKALFQHLIAETTP